jgi:hypothetical protein
LASRRPQNEALDQTDFQTNRASGKAKSYIQGVLVQRTMGGHQMRRELRAPKGAETLTYSFHFQISNKGGRQACSVKVQAPNFQDATTFFRQNFPQIEFMARDHLANAIGDCRPTTQMCALRGAEDLPIKGGQESRAMARRIE